MMVLGYLAFVGSLFFPRGGSESEGRPEWAEKWQVQAALASRFVKRWESSNPQNSPELGAFVRTSPCSGLWVCGLQIGLGETTLGGRSQQIDLGNGSSSKALTAHEAYVGVKPRRGNWQGEVVIGKFVLQDSVSALLWDADLRPEGLYESGQVYIGDNWIARAYAAQIAVEPTAAGRRSWLFIEGVAFAHKFSSQLRAKISAHHLSFLKPNSSLAAASQPAGNSIFVGARPLYLYGYHPAEAVLEISGEPLGVHMGISSAFAINWFTPKDDRAFVVNGFVGKPWEARNWAFNMGYFYSEPDVTISFLSEDEWGNTNRKGPYVETSYFMTSFSRLGASYRYLDTLALSVFQARRHELWIETEFIF